MTVVLCACMFQWGRIGVPSERPTASNRLPRTVRILPFYFISLLCIVGLWLPKDPSSSLVLNVWCPACLLKGVCDVQFGSRLVFRGRLLHHTLQRPRRPVIPETHPPHQEHPHSTVEGNGAQTSCCSDAPFHLKHNFYSNTCHPSNHHSHLTLWCFC